VVPDIYVEMHLIFDNNFDVDTITQVVGIRPFKCMNKTQTRINPITNQHNPGFWTIRSRTFSEFDVKQAIDDLLSNIERKISLIKEICSENKGNVVFEIVPSFYYNAKPAIYFNRQFLKVVEELEAEIELDMYVLGEQYDETVG